MLWHQQVQLENATGCSSDYFHFLTISTAVISDQAVTRQPSNTHPTLVLSLLQRVIQVVAPPNAFPLFISQGLIRERRNRERSGLRAAL